MQTDTELTNALLAALAMTVAPVAAAHRREGIARRLVQQALAHTRCTRLDVISCADPFYEQFGFKRVSGFRLPAVST